MTTKKVPNLSTSGESPHSKLDLWSGKHTTSIIVALLFVITLICFVVLYCKSNKLSEDVTTGLFGLLGVLAGFFAGSNINKN